MKLDKSNKRIMKMVKKGFLGYPMISISYYGPTESHATKVTVTFTAEEDSEAQTETFITENDIREDPTIQSTIVKIIERSGAKSVDLIDRIIVND